MIEVVLLIALGFALGWKLNEILHYHAFMQLMRDLGIKERDLRKLAERNGISLPEPVMPAAEDLEEIHVKIEQHGTEIYAFRTDNEEFLGQGNDADALIKHISLRFNNIRMIIDQGQEFMLKDPDKIG
jgi:hypothetical protein